MRSATWVATPKSGVCRFSVTRGADAKSLGTSRSTVAPPGTRPALGTLSAMREPSRPSTPKPLTTRLPCAIA